MTAEASNTDENYWVHGDDWEVYRLINTQDLHGDYPGELIGVHVSWQGAKGWNRDARTPGIPVTAVAFPVLRTTTRPNEFCPAGVEFLSRWEVGVRLRELGVVASIGALNEEELASGLSEKRYRRSSLYRESRRNIARKVLDWLKLPLTERPRKLDLNSPKLGGVLRFEPAHGHVRTLLTLLLQLSARELVLGGSGTPVSAENEGSHESDPQIITLNVKDGDLGYLAATKTSGVVRDSRRTRRQIKFSNVEILFPIEQLAIANGKMADSLRELSTEDGCTDDELLALLGFIAQPASIAGATNLNDLTKIVSGGNRLPTRADQLIAYSVQRFLALPFASRFARLRDNEFWAITDVKMKLSLRPPKDAERYFSRIAKELNIKRKQGQYEDNRH